MALLATTQSFLTGTTSFFFNFPIVLPAQISGVPSWPTQFYVLPAEKVANGITFRFTVPSPANGSLDFALKDSA